MTTMTATATGPLTVDLDQHTRTRIGHLARSRKSTSAALICDAVGQYLEREEQQRIALRQTALEAWEELQTTGLHADAGEVQAWLSSWGSDGELPAPACHQ